MNEVVSFDNETPQSMALAPRDPAAVAAAEQAKAEIQMSFMLALSRPRDVMMARKAILDSAKRPGFAEIAEYSRPVGGKKNATGATIRFAEEFRRAFKNVMVRQNTVLDSDTERRVVVTAIDLENNVSSALEIVVKKLVERKSVPKDRDVLGTRTNSYGDKVYICEATSDEVEVQVASRAARARRNVLMELFPSDIVEEAMAACRDTRAREDAQDPKAALKKLIDRFGDYGVTPEHLAQYLGHPVESVTTSELAELRAAGVAMHTEGVKWSDIMAAKNGTAEDQATNAFAERASKKVDELRERTAGEGKTRAARGSRAAKPAAKEGEPNRPAAAPEASTEVGDLLLRAQKWIVDDDDRNALSIMAEAGDVAALENWLSERETSGDEPAADPAVGLFD